MCLVMALMCASGVAASPGCLGRFPRLGLSSPYLPLAAGLAWLTGSWTPFQGWLLYPLCCTRTPKVPRVLAALQPALPPPVSQPRQGDCAQGMPPRAVVKAHVKKYQFSITVAVQLPGESGHSPCPAPNPSLVLTHLAGSHFCSHRHLHVT